MYLPWGSRLVSGGEGTQHDGDGQYVIKPINTRMFTIMVVMWQSSQRSAPGYFMDDQCPHAIMLTSDLLDAALIFPAQSTDGLDIDFVIDHTLTSLPARTCSCH